MNPMEVTTNEAGAAGAVDEALYSRQLYVMGREAQQRMAQSDVLIVGLNGVGVESAKNIILAGVRSVTLHDDSPTEMVDLAGQFYLTEGDVGTPRAQATAPKLAELNPYVPVSVHAGPLTHAVLSRFAVVLLVGLPLSQQTDVAHFCHDNNIRVVIAESAGVYCKVFCDFGEKFIVSDVNGEPAVGSMIASITQSSPCLITVLDENRHQLNSGDSVTLSDIKGMEQLNGTTHVVTVKDPHSFEIPVDASNFPPHKNGGYVQQLKMPTEVNFTRFADSYNAPGEFICDYTKFDRSAPLHVAFRVMHLYVERYGCLPEPGNQAHAQQFFDLCVSTNLSATNGGASAFRCDGLEGYEAYLKRFALCCRGQCNPICALLGGVVGQEVLKACSGKFMPVKQWFYYDAAEALSDEPLPMEEVAPMGCRYDGQIMIFGRSMQRQLHGLSMFLVGAGAIGCEMMKNWAMMGVACDVSNSMQTDASPSQQPKAQKSRNTGMVYITDMDHIEKSNLSRQFLFRSTDINRPKSITAANAAKGMNRSFRVHAYECKVAPETESTFSDDFFESLDCVCTALDNVEARLYVDQRCLFYHKPLLESGTLGAKGNTQVVVPFKTEHYGAQRDAPEQSIPVCTLKHFPNTITHTLQWAREWFEEQYKQVPDVTNQYLSLPQDAFLHTLASQQNMKLDSLEKIRESLLLEFPTSIDNCIAWARIRFEDLFCNKIQQLLTAFPLDKVTDGGVPFWSGSKRAPNVIKFDEKDALHMEFIASCAHMRAAMFGIQYDASIWEPKNAASLHSILSTVRLPEFKAQTNVKIPTTEEEAKQQAAAGSGSSSSSFVDVDQECNNILGTLPPPATFNQFAPAEAQAVIAASSTSATQQPAVYRLQSIDFEKDSDSHMRVVAATSNLRARNYAIKEEDLHTSRGIAGKITPAIATTTGYVAGTVCLELFKLLQNKPVTAHMNCFANLALPLFASMEPEPPKFHTTIVKGKEWKWSQWDRIDINQPSMTLRDLVNHVESEYGVSLSMLSAGVTILYSDFMNRAKKEERMKLKVPDVVELVTKKPIFQGQKYLIFELLCVDEETDDELELPYLRFRLF